MKEVRFALQMMTYDAHKRPSATRLLAHPFISRYQKSERLVPSRSIKSSVDHVKMETFLDSIDSPKIKAGPSTFGNARNRDDENHQVTPRCKSEKFPRKVNRTFICPKGQYQFQSNVSDPKNTAIICGQEILDSCQLGYINFLFMRKGPLFGST